MEKQQPATLSSTRVSVEGSNPSSSATPLIIIPDPWHDDIKEAMQREYFCIKCGKTYRRPSLTSTVSCLVWHSDESCCHYGDKEIL